MCKDRISTVDRTTDHIEDDVYAEDESYARLNKILERIRTRSEHHDFHPSFGPATSTVQTSTTPRAERKSPPRPVHKRSISKDTWSKHVELIDMEMCAYELSGTCAHHWDHDVTHREPDDLSKFTRVLVYLDSYTRGCATEQLKELDLHFGLLEAQTRNVLTASACLDAAETNIENEWPEDCHNTAKRETSKGETPRKTKLNEAYSKALDRLKEEQTAMDHVLKLFANKLLYAGVDIWNSKPNCVHDESLQQGLDMANTALEKANASIKQRDADIKALTLELEAAKSKTLEMERMLKTSKRDVEKTYYEDVQKRVESRVADVKLELSNRMSLAESKALQYDRIKAENTTLQIRVAQLEKESGSHCHAKDEFEQQLKKRNEELVFLREGYDQFRTDAYSLQMENNTLQVDLHDLKDDHRKLGKERDTLLDKLGCANASNNITQPIMQAGGVTSFDRQTAELQHLDGLISVWQNTLDTATAKKDQSLAAKTAVDIKVREAKAQVMKLKDPCQKRIQSSHKSVKRVGSSVPAPTEMVVARAANSLRPVEPTRPKNKLSAAKEAFPALGIPVVVSRRVDSMIAQKTLRLVDGVIKAKKPEGESV